MDRGAEMAWEALGEFFCERVNEEKSEQRLFLYPSYLTKKYMDKSFFTAMQLILSEFKFMSD